MSAHETHTEENEFLMRSRVHIFRFVEHSKGIALKELEFSEPEKWLLRLLAYRIYVAVNTFTWSAYFVNMYKLQCASCCS